MTGQQMSVVDELRPILAKNYAAIGWALLDLEQCESGGFGSTLRGKIRCPCGGMEYFNMLLDEDVDVLLVARSVLGATASRGHIERDIADGTLPPMSDLAIEACSFGGRLVLPDAA